MAMAVENSHSEHSTQTNTGVVQENHSASQNHNPGQNNVNGQGHGSGGHESNTGTNASHDGQSNDSQSQSHGNEHGSKPVKDVNITPWVITFLAYITGVLVLAAILRKGKVNNNNELVR